MNWEKLFAPHILERGYDYYREGAVTDIRVNGSTIEATVEGSEEYAVSIEWEKGKIAKMECSCPYAKDGTYCKHMAAVLYAYEDDHQEKNGSSSTDQTTPTLTYEQLQEQVGKADPALVDKFLTDILWKNEAWRQRFLAILHPDDQGERLIASAKHRLDEIADAAGGYDGYIDYYAASRFIAEIGEWMDEEIDPLLERRQDRSAFDLSIHVMKTLDGVEMDDSDGGITEIASRCYDTWGTILDHGDSELEQEMFEFFLDNLDGQIVDYLEDYYESILMARFEKPEYLEKKRSLYQGYLNAVDPASTDWTTRHRAEQCIDRIQTLLRQLNRPREEIIAFQKKYWAYPVVRKAYMEECQQNGQWDQLINVLKESIILDEQERFGSVRQYHLMLKDAYLQAGQTEAYREELWRIATEITPGDIDIFRECKALFTEDQWPAKREELFSATREKRLQNRLLSEEKLFARLLENVLAASGLYALREYEAELLPFYPKKVLEKYVSEINKAAQNAAGRDAYQDWVKTLRHMRELPDGREAVQRIVGEWRILYRRRKAMMDELDTLS